MCAGQASPTCAPRHWIPCHPGLKALAEQLVLDRQHLALQHLASILPVDLCSCFATASRRKVAGVCCDNQPVVTAVPHTLLFLYGLVLALTPSVVASLQQVAKCVQVMWFARLAVTMQKDDTIQKL